MTVINTNISSLKTQAAITSNTRGLEKAMQQLSTGKRINSAADDAAGLTIASAFRGQIKSLNQEIRNAADGISLLQTAEGSSVQITSILQRMRELVTQALNGTYSDDDISNMGTEVTALKEEINRIATDTMWNGYALLDGSFTDRVAAVSDSALNAISIDTADLQTSALDGIDDIDFTNPSDVTTDWLDSIDGALTTVSNHRASFGARMNRLNYTIDNLTNAATNMAASASRIEDTDYSQATSDLAKFQVIQQAATAMLAQANQSTQLVLQLLK